MGTKCSEGPAVSRTGMKISWTVAHTQYPGEMEKGQYVFYLADIVYRKGLPELANRRLIFDNTDTPYRDIEVQNFIPPHEKEITSDDLAGVGYGIFIKDLEEAAKQGCR